MSREVDEIFKLNNIKPTAMRELVYKVLDKSQKALSLSEIEQQFDKVERSTIFRTLKTFQDKNLVHNIDDGSGAIKFALCDEECTCNLDDLHIHFICNKCGQTLCMKNIPVPKVDLPNGFSIESVNFVAQGICSNCQ